MRCEIYLIDRSLIRVSMVSDVADHGVNSTQFMKLLAVNLVQFWVMFAAAVTRLPGKRAAAEGLNMNRLR